MSRNSIEIKGTILDDLLIDSKPKKRKKWIWDKEEAMNFYCTSERKMKDNIPRR